MKLLINYTCFVFLSIITLFCLPGCSKDSPTAPPEVTDDALVTKTIDAGGGIIETDDFKLEVPLGAFSSAVVLKLYEGANNVSGENAVTKSYNIRGIPLEFAKPLSAGIKYSGSLKNESFIYTEHKFLVKNTGDTVSTYDFIPANDSSGFLWAQLPSLSGGTVLKSNSYTSPKDEIIDFLNDVTLGGFSDYTSNQTAHFKLSIPANQADRTNNILNIFENNYQVLTNDNKISFDDKWWNWPISLKVINEVNTEHQYSVMEVYAGYPWEDIIISIDQSFVENNDFQGIKIESGKDLINLALLSNSRHGDAGWIRRAVYTWSEELFWDVPANFVSPENFRPNFMSPFYGMIWSTDLNPQAHYNYPDGMSSVMKYLINDTSKFGYSGLKKTLEATKTGTDPASALITNVQALKADWLPDFFRKYVGGENYNVPASSFIADNNLTGTWPVNTESDTLWEFYPTVQNVGQSVGPYPDLSAKMFMVNLNYANISPSKSLFANFTGEANSDGLSTIIYGYKNGSLEHLIQGNANEPVLEIQNLKEQYDKGYRQFLIVVVNSNGIPPYNGKSNVYLTLKVSDEEEVINEILYSNRCIVHVKFNGHYQSVDTAGHTSEYDQEDDWGNYEAIGSFSGNTFMGNYTDNLGRSIGTITATLNAGLDTVISVNWNEDFTDTYLGNTTNAHTSVSAFSLPKSEYPGVFGIWGAETCNHLVSLEYNQQDWTGSATLQSYTCNANKLISIGFRKE